MNGAMIRTILTAASLFLGTALVAGPAAVAWDIGPVVRGENRSVGMPETMYESSKGAAFTFPRRGGQVKYVTTDVRTLEGASSITFRYRIDAEPGARIVSREYPGRPATVSLYFQRQGDNWTARGRYETYRWYVKEPYMLPLTPGVHEVTVDMKDDWRAVFRSTSDGDPREFAAAVRNASEVGFVFGSAQGRGHGVFATGQATFTLLEFDVR